MNRLRQNYKMTVYSCFLAYIVQSVVNSFAPLLFVTFHREFSVPMSQITFLITFNFGTQLLVDLVSAKYVDKIGYRAGMLLSMSFSVLGLAGLTVLPTVLPNAFAGLLLSSTLYAIGGGLQEVLVSPIVEACPTDNKEAAMSLLHSFYCWGCVLVIGCSTLFFNLVGIEHWRVLALLWCLVPLINGILFSFVPIAPIVAEGETAMKISDLLKSKLFWVFLLMMICSGASEQSVSQWASVFAEESLGISKNWSDLAGPLMFSVMMGSSRALYGKWGEKMNLDKFMIGSTLLCVVAYLLTSLSASPVFSLIGCALCGFSVGIMWPGTFSKAAASLRTGGTAMFAFLALGGDIGCMSGPTFAGFVSDLAGNNLKIGILAAILFPMLLLLCLFFLQKKKRKTV